MKFPISLPTPNFQRVAPRDHEASIPATFPDLVTLPLKSIALIIFQHTHEPSSARQRHTDDNINDDGDPAADFTSLVTPDKPYLRLAPHCELWINGDGDEYDDDVSCGQESGHTSHRGHESGTSLSLSACIRDKADN